MSLEDLISSSPTEIFVITLCQSIDAYGKMYIASRTFSGERLAYGDSCPTKDIGESGTTEVSRTVREVKFGEAKIP